MRDAPPLTPQGWDDWFANQATWTGAARGWMYERVGLARAQAVLDVGCGTGALLDDLPRSQGGLVVGLDVSWELLAFAARRHGGVSFARGDAHGLPFGPGAFDVVLCHFVLLWLERPRQALEEMVRVVRPGGWVVACAEPDYGGRIDHPPELAPLGEMQREALRRQGADPEMGRRLAGLFAGAGLQVTVGTLAGQWQRPAAPGEAFEAEWRMRAWDLGDAIAPDELARLKEADRQAMERGERVLFVPTFYALGQKGGLSGR